MVDLQALEDMAGTMIDTASLEIIFKCPPGHLAVAIEEQTEEGLAVLRGRLLVEAKLRKSIITLALAGSGPAQAMAKSYIDQLRVEEI